jgi:hydrogenase maturation protein HypF
MVRIRLAFRGIIQGVGFRPAIWRLAAAAGLTGFVQNRRSEVVAEVQGTEDAVARFRASLGGGLPGAARVSATTERPLTVVAGERAFAIIESLADAWAFPPIPPDLPPCPACLGEMLDPGNRRYLYPFITCTQCGPRYSIVERTPFDRVNTAMAPFAQCPDCEREYRDPGDRRFHSQTNSCPRCGPRLTCVDAQGKAMTGAPVPAAIAVLRAGGVLALQGVGGFHLAADPRHEDAVAHLRREKERERKPFALMVRDLAEARLLCRLTAVEESLLSSTEAPIVIAPRRDNSPAWLDAVSDTGTLGVMLPSSPLHALLYRQPDAGADYGHLVMTSGNRASAPIVTDPDEARDKLEGAADAFLFHDRRIVFRSDDSILRAGPSTPAFLLRRSRGHVPRLLHLARPVTGVVLATGGDLKNAPAVARGTDLHLCPYIGDLDDQETAAQFDEQVRAVLSLYGAAPDLIVHDLHPGYRSTGWAVQREERRTAIQHHFAHALSVMAEHGLDESLALSFDGTGYGTDGTTWGGEFLHATRSGFTRLGSFAPFPLPGGDEAVRHPPRTAFALLGDEASGRLPGLSPGEEAVLRAMIARGVNAPITTSLGRIFDAAAAALGLVRESLYEGEGPIRLEGCARSAWAGPGTAPHGDAGELAPLLPGPGDSRLFLADARPVLRRLLDARVPVARRALLFHEAVAAAAVRGALLMREETGLALIALGGGVFQNVLLRELVIPPLIKEGFEVFLNSEAPPGDGGLSVGQAWFEER